MPISTAIFRTLAGIKVLDIDFHVENKGKYNLYTNLYTLDMQGKTTYKDIVNKLSECANIQRNPHAEHLIPVTW